MDSQDILSSEWRNAVKAIKSAILQSQYRAAKSVNREQLSLYFGIGRYISEHSRKGFWGTGAIERISEQLQKELPGLRGFGVASIKNMRQFYESWASYFNSVAVAAELSQKKEQDTDNSSNSLTVVSELQEDHINIDVKNFIMTFGRDFTFVGNQYHIEKFGLELNLHV